MADYPMSFEMAVGLGLVDGFDYVHKYGRNPIINTADGFESIWQGGRE